MDGLIELPDGSKYDDCGDYFTSTIFFVLFQVVDQAPGVEICQLPMCALNVYINWVYGRWQLPSVCSILLLLSFLMPSHGATHLNHPRLHQI